MTYVFVVFCLDKIPPENWPNAGKIVFRNLNLFYSPDSPCILKNLNFQIQPMEKVILTSFKYVEILKRNLFSDT